MLTAVIAGELAADVLVVGAGPAGTATAAGLALRGMKVLIADPADPETAPGQTEGPRGERDVLLTGPALRGLESLGISVPAGTETRDTIELRFSDGPSRAVTGTGARVRDWDGFLRTLRQLAAGAGARFVRGTVTGLTREAVGYRAETGHGRAVITATHVVVACGSGRGALVPDGASHSAGVACAQRFTSAAPGTPVVLALPGPSAVPDDLPRCVWALPHGDDMGDGDGTVTVGVTGIGDVGADPGELLAAGLRLLRVDPRFADVRPAGPVTSGPVDTGYAPARIRQAGYVLVGDAAGLANPFTGEGLSYAVHSALIATRAITAHRSDPDAARRLYARRLAATFVGYFETARHAGRRYQLAWRILAAGADSEHPFFAKGRRAVLLPEGFSGLTVAAPLAIARPDAARLAVFLAACDEVAISVVRDEWPFLGRLAMTGDGTSGQRPAIPFFAALMAAGREPDITRATLAAAIELALLGATALLGPVPPPADGRGVDWALASALLAGDFLLAQASKLIARSAPELSWSFGDWLGELAGLRAARLSQPPGVPAAAVFGSLLEFPARVGAQLGGGTPEIVAALRDFGRWCGYAFAHAEDILALRGERTRLDTTLEVMLRGGFSGVPDYLGGMLATPESLAGDSRLRERALDTAVSACRQALRKALAATAALPDSVACRILRAFALTIAQPALDCDDIQ